MILRIQSNLYHIQKRFVQALFVNHFNATGNVRALWPIFDYRYRLENRHVLEDNIKRRRLDNQINVDELYEQWEIYKTIEPKKKTIEKKQTILKKNRFKLKSIENLNDKQATWLKHNVEEAKELKKEYKIVCDSFYDIEARFNNNFLALPNILLSNTPNEPEIVLTHEEESTESHNKLHLNYDNLIEYFDDKTYYLKNDAAKFNQFFPLKCLNHFEHHGFAPFSNTDFVKTVVVEGSAIPLENVYEIQHEFHENCTNLVHLVGAGSWLSFMGFISHQLIEKEILPMKMVSSGKVYKLTKENDFGLFDAAQSTEIQLFSAGTEEQMNEQFKLTLELIIQIFKSIGMHFRVVHVPDNQLKLAECFATQIEMFSPHLKNYMEIGRLSHYGDYISKRLRFRCEIDENNTNYKPHIVCGTVCNVEKLLAIILETNNGIIPNALFKNEF